MATKKLELVPTLTESFTLGAKNLFPLLLAIILYVLTCWIPYLNVGTTIGMYRLIIDMTRKQVINPLSIFDKENFTQLGDVFLLVGLLFIGIFVAFMCMFIPGIVMSIAWGYALYLLIEKKVSPIKALSLSWKSTYGEKWTIFLIELLVSILIMLVAGLLALIPKVGPFLAVVAVIFSASYVVALEAVLYRHFSGKADRILEEKACCDQPEAVAAPAAEEAEAPAAE